MSIFQCEHCGCFDNTSLAGATATKFFPEWYDWTGIEDRKGKELCSACTPAKYADGSGGEDGTGKGKWHGQWNQQFFPMGEFETDPQGDLRHKKTKLSTEKWLETKEGKEWTKKESLKQSTETKNI